MEQSDISLIQVKTSNHMRVFKNLLQLYEYEFSSITKLEINERGFFVNKELERAIQNKTCELFLLQFNSK